MKCDVSRDHCYSWWTNDHLWDHWIMLNGKLCEVFFNKYHQFHYLISVQTAWKDTLELHLMSKKYVDKEYVSGCISVLPLTWSLVKHAIPSSMGKIYTLSKRLKSQPGKEVHILNKFLLWILISQSKGFFFESSWPFL